MPSSLILTITAIFFAAITQSLAGFGSSLVAISIIAPLVGLTTATPLVVLVNGLIQAFLFVRYFNSFNLSVTWRLVIASFAGIPIGMFFLENVDENIATSILGIFVLGYAIYSLLNLKLPEMKQPIWAYLSGFFAGLASGAFSTGGPPVVIYGNANNWSPEEFKSNLQGYFIPQNCALLISHTIKGHYSPDILLIFLKTVPFILMGLYLGNKLSNRLNPTLFRKIVLFILTISGIKMVLPV